MIFMLNLPRKGKFGILNSYRAALTEWTRDRVPLQWAMTQNNLGNALAMPGERQGIAYCAALTERTCKPRHSAMACFELGSNWSWLLWEGLRLGTMFIKSIERARRMAARLRTGFDCSIAPSVDLHPVPSIMSLGHARVRLCPGAKEQ